MTPKSPAAGREGAVTGLAGVEGGRAAPTRRAPVLVSLSAASIEVEAIRGVRRYDSEVFFVK